MEQIKCTTPRESLPHVWTTTEAQAKLRAFVLAPQCPPDKYWVRPSDEALRLALAILDVVAAEYSIDLDRVYVAGQSMGGEGTWAALALGPGRFAAAVPLCGYGDDSTIARVTPVPVWIFQGMDDPIVSVARAHEWVAALREAGGRPKYSEYPGVGHQIWVKAFAEPALVGWLASQRRGQPPATATSGRPGAASSRAH